MISFSRRSRARAMPTPFAKRLPSEHDRVTPKAAVGPAFGSIIAPQTKGKRNADRRIDPSSAPPPYYRITISEDRPGFFRTVYAARPRLHFTFRCPPTAAGVPGHAAVGSRTSNRSRRAHTVLKNKAA